MKNKVSKMLIGPSMGAILLTYRCPAECDECCFECGPYLQNSTLDFEDIKTFIDKISNINTLKLLVWSGGECFLEYSKLIEGISYANSKKLPSRCVTNGFWATSIEQAKKKLEPLKKAGLIELNFSTGDSHQQFVSVDRVLNGTVAALELGLTVFIAVETNKSKKFTVSDFKNHEIYRKYIKNTILENRCKVTPTIWVSFHKNNIYTYEDDFPTNSGCSGIFDTLSLEPRRGALSCCGLTANHIKEMHLGSVQSPHLLENYFKQQADFLKIWIFTEGPEEIVNQACEWLNQSPPRFHHKCLYCAYLYNSDEIKQVIFKNYTKIKNRVLDKYRAKCIMQDEYLLMEKYHEI